MTSKTSSDAATPNDDYLVWLDMEMSGLDPETHRILEIALVVTDSQLQVVAHAPVYVVHQTAE
ncbi:MAG: exonuclease domain-containing protein, partial [Burkholderiaceae bacterium]